MLSKNAVFIEEYERCRPPMIPGFCFDEDLLDEDLLDYGGISASRLVVLNCQLGRNTHRNFISKVSLA